MPGPPPKDHSVSPYRRRLKAKGQTERGAAAPTRRAPSSPPPFIPQADPKWLPVARSWYNSLMHCSHTATWEASDWTTAVCAAVALDRFMRTNNASLLGSFIRLAERLGATEISRRAAGISNPTPRGQADVDERAANKAVEGWQRRLTVVKDD